MSFFRFNFLTTFLYICPSPWIFFPQKTEIEMNKKQYFWSTEQKKRKLTHTVTQEYSPVTTAAEQRSLPVVAPTVAPVTTTAEQRSSPVLAPTAASITTAPEQKSSPVMAAAASGNVFVNICHMIFF